MSLSLKASKTDAFHQGQLGVYLLDPLLMTSQARRVSSRSTIYLSQRAQFLYWRWLSAAAAGLPDLLLKVLGGWSLDCYQLYIRTPGTMLLSAAPRMASVPYL